MPARHIPSRPTISLAAVTTTRSELAHPRGWLLVPAGIRSSRLAIIAAPSTSLDCDWWATAVRCVSKWCTLTGAALGGGFYSGFAAGAELSSW